jgi:hypothetical protein
MPQKTLTKKQQTFVQFFIDMVWENMHIEQETPYTKKQAYRRYYQDALDMIEDGTYKRINIKK